MKMIKHQISLITLFESLLLCFVGGYLTYLDVSGGLTYYIRPDYNTFTLVMGLVLIAAGALNVGFLIATSRPVSLSFKFPFIDTGKIIVIALVIACGFVIPKKGLSAQTATRRGANQNFLAGQQALKGPKIDVHSLTTSPLTGKSISNNYTLADWMGLFQIDPEPGSYEGKAVNVIGFVQPQKDGTFAVTRYVISCCIADATPIGLLVDRQLEDLKADDWVRVSGKFEVKTIKEDRQVIIKPESVTKITAPAEPYLY